MLFYTQHGVDNLLLWDCNGLFVPLLAVSDVFVQISDGVSQERLHIHEGGERNTEAIPNLSLPL